jgi:hypothetical protein
MPKIDLKKIHKFKQAPNFIEFVQKILQNLN